MSLENKIVLVTGSGDGIGKAIATAFALNKARLMLCDVNGEVLEKTVEEMRQLGAEAYGVQYNASKPEEVEKVFNATIEKYGDIDCLVNNVGIAGPTKPVQDITMDEWTTTFAVDVNSTFYMCKLAAPYMIKKKAGKIVNMSSISGKHALLNRSPYCAAKMAVIGLTRCLAKELGVHNITVNAVCPGGIDNARGAMVYQKQAEARGVTVEEVINKTLEQYCLKHLVPMSDVAEMVLFLCDEEKSNSITGLDINVSCGAYL
ncbi:MAG: SDR family NAD(P)-dependent oxidoreductase [Anaerovoracaceae bacterium]